MKKIIFSFLLFVGLVPLCIRAGSGSLAMVGGRYYDSLEEAIENASSKDTITLISNVDLDDTLNINKNVNINLNGNNIVTTEKVFFVRGGFLTLTGKGKVRETKPNYGAIMIVGSTNSNNANYSGVSIGKDVTLEGWSGIFITHDSNKSYGVNVYLEGKINAVNDTSGGAGTGIYVNGNIKDEELSPVINITDGAEIKSTGNGLYMAGYSNFYIDKAYIEGVESAIGMKSGKLIINGATLTATGEYQTQIEGNNNGIKPTGSTIQIESNNNYKGKMEIDISSGELMSKNSNVIYEYIGSGNASQVYSISISGGTFESNKSKDIFNFSESFNDIHSKFISGGTYSTNPKKYLKKGYNILEDNGMYIVVKNVMKEVDINNYKANNSNKFIKSLIFILSLSSIILFVNFKNVLKK